MPHVIGTAGHIDHGKTALIRALTGQETDRLKEERERGISIDLGFAYIDVSGGERAGIVDVPGHERFIRNMLAGAHGIDLVLLVVAADDGVMPQTEEHVDILHLLGASHGVVAITKADLVDAVRLLAVREEVEILLAGTTLEGCPMVPVSAMTGRGVADLRQTLEAALRGYSRAAAPGPFRMPIDRAFVMHGHGVVVTGTSIAGTVRSGDAVRIQPGGFEARVRSIQVHGGDVATAAYGQRVALNLAGIERAGVTRGQVVCDPSLDRDTDRCDVWVEIRPAAGKPVRSHDVVHVHMGTAETMGKLVLLGESAALAPRDAGLAQLVLRDRIHALRGDRFILRNASAQRTIGGGSVIHPFAWRHARSERGLLDGLRALHRASVPGEIVSALLALEPAFAVGLDHLAQVGALSAGAVVDALKADSSVRLLPDRTKPTACTTAAKWERLRAAATEALAEAHQREPLSPGLEMESLRSQLAPDLSAKLFRAVVDALVAAGTLARQESVLRLPTHKTTLRRDEQELGTRAERLLTGGGFTPPDLKQLEIQLGVTRTRLQGVLQQLEREGRIARIGGDLYFAREPLERARGLLRAHVEAHGEISAASFRDLLDASRKFSISLLDYFDRTGFTLRVGDVRKLRR